MNFHFVRILDNGNYRFDFSETFYKLDDLMKGGKNLTLLNKNKMLIFELNYTTEMQNEELEL